MTDTDRLAALLREDAGLYLEVLGITDDEVLWNVARGIAARLIAAGVTLAPAEGLKPTLPPPDPRLVGTEYRPLFPAAPAEELEQRAHVACCWCGEHHEEGN